MVMLKDGISIVCHQILENSQTLLERAFSTDKGSPSLDSFLRIEGIEVSKFVSPISRCRIQVAVTLLLEHEHQESDTSTA